MSNKSVVVWGAGRIGRGFAADLFHAGGYHITLVDQVTSLVERLKAAGRYTVVKAESAGRRRDEVIAGYTALSPAQSEEVAAAIAAADSVVVAVFPQEFPHVARQLAAGLLQRQSDRPEAALDILVCTNLSNAAEQFHALLVQALPSQMQRYAAERIGVVGTVTIRAVADPPPELLESDPLVVLTDGFEDFPVARQAFKGDIPHIPGLRPVDDLHAEEIRKLYTYNMCHAALAYLGARRGHILSVDCFADPWVRAKVEGALQETSRALQAGCGFSESDMDSWIAAMLSRVNNPALGDRIARLGGDPRRKLRRDDRLVGPALLARRHGIRPVHLARTVAAGLLFQNPDDPGAVYVQEHIAELGVPAAVRDLCELTPVEDDLVAMIVEAYQDLAGPVE